MTEGTLGSLATMSPADMSMAAGDPAITWDPPAAVSVDRRRAATAIGRPPRPDPRRLLRHVLEGVECREAQAPLFYAL